EAVEVAHLRHRHRLLDGVPRGVLELDARLPIALVRSVDADANITEADALALDERGNLVVEVHPRERLARVVDDGVGDGLDRRVADVPAVVAEDHDLLGKAGGGYVVGVLRGGYDLVGGNLLGGLRDNAQYRVEDQVAGLAGAVRRLARAASGDRGGENLEDVALVHVGVVVAPV